MWNFSSLLQSGLLAITELNADATSIQTALEAARFRCWKSSHEARQSHNLWRTWTHSGRSLLRRDRRSAIRPRRSSLSCNALPRQASLILQPSSHRCSPDQHLGLYLFWNGITANHWNSDRCTAGRRRRRQGRESVVMPPMRHGKVREDRDSSFPQPCKQRTARRPIRSPLRTCSLLDQQNEVCTVLLQ